MLARPKIVHKQMLQPKINQSMKINSTNEIISIVKDIVKMVNVDKTDIMGRPIYSCFLKNSDILTHIFSGMDPIMENSPITGRKQYNNAGNNRYDSPDSPQTPEAWRSPDSPPSPISPISPNSPDSPGMQEYTKTIGPSVSATTLDKIFFLETAYYYTRRQHRDYDF